MADDDTKDTPRRSKRTKKQPAAVVVTPGPSQPKTPQAPRKKTRQQLPPAESDTPSPLVTTDPTFPPPDLDDMEQEHISFIESLITTPPPLRLDDTAPPSSMTFEDLISSMILSSLRHPNPPLSGPTVESVPVDRTTPDEPAQNDDKEGTQEQRIQKSESPFIGIRLLGVPPMFWKQQQQQQRQNNENGENSSEGDDELREKLLSRTKELKAWQALNGMGLNGVSELPLRERIILSDASPLVKSMLLRKYREAHGQSGYSPDPFETHASRLIESNPEATKVVSWIETALQYPHGIVKPIVLKGELLGPVEAPPEKREVSIFSHLNWLKSSLDEHVFGHETVKKCILAYVARMLTGPKDGQSRLVLCLNGPPGTGKTRMVRIGIAGGLGLPMSCISLGGMKDANLLTGHSSTYIGARPGAIVNAITNARQENCVIFMDEVDKVGSENGQEISGVLTHALDPESNHSWDGDHYMQPLRLNLSRVVFVLACNDLDRIHSVALDRMYVIHVPDLTRDQKRVITQRHIFPEALDAFQLKDRVELAEDGADYLLSIVADKGKGLREMKRCVDVLLERIMLLKLFYEKSNDLQQACSEVRALGFELNLPSSLSWPSNPVDVLKLDKVWAKAVYEDVRSNGPTRAYESSMYT